MRWAGIVVILLIASLVRADESWSRPDEASQIAARDIGRVDLHDHPFQRYVWIQSGEREEAAAVSYAINTAASTSPNIYSGVQANGSPHVMRWDLRRLAPEEKDLRRLIANWEKLADDEPWFHAPSFVEVRQTVKPYVARDGKTYDYIFKRDKQFALAADVNSLLNLKALTRSNVPIVEGKWLLARLLNTSDKGIGKGLYYEFRGIERNPAKGTAEEAFYAKLGADAKNIGARAADEKAGIFRSGVTDKPRVLIVFYGTQVRPSVGLPIVTATFDLADGKVDPKQHPIYNLLKFDHDASEVIGVLPNGMLIYALFNAKGELQDVVPDTIARDDTEHPHSAILEPARSCIVCHGKPKEEGFKPFLNDAKLLINHYDRLGSAVFDRNQKNIFASIEQLRGLYTGNLGPVLDQARNAHHSAAYRATRGVWGDDSTAGVARKIDEAYRWLLSTPINARVACRELGLPITEDMTENEAAALYAEWIVPLPVDDPTIVRISLGDTDGQTRIGRPDWYRVLQDCLLRAARTRIDKALIKEE